jgi:membrane dipeptidase
MQPVFDGHNDAITREDAALIAEGRPDGHLDLPRMRAGGMRGGIFAVFTPSPGEEWNENTGVDGVTEVAYAESVGQATAAGYATGAAGRLFALERAGHLRIARSIADIDAARDADGLPVAVLHHEGAEAIDDGLEALELWRAAGLRSLGPVWSRANSFASGVPFRWPSSPDTGPGLSESGRALVRRCGQLGILADLSHLNEAGFWDVARIGPGPLVASHSGAHALCQTSRNLTDAQLDEIARTGGLVGIVYACPFLRADFADDADTPLSLIAEHARYVADRIGVEHVALGSDFDGATIPAELGGVDGLPKLLAALSDCGFSVAEIDAIAWSNWRRVLAAWWGEA